MIFHLWIAGDINILAHGSRVAVPSSAVRSGDLRHAAVLPSSPNPAGRRGRGCSHAAGRCGQGFSGLCTQQANRWAGREIAAAFTAL